MRPLLLIIGLVLCLTLIAGCIQGSTKPVPDFSTPAPAPDGSIEEQYSRFEQPCYDEINQSSCHAPPSFSGTLDLVIDNSLVQSTPHWMLLAAGKTEQEGLLKYIREADIPADQKTAWSRFMMKMWMKCPVRYVRTGTSSKLVPADTPCTLTPDENAVFTQIESYIAEDMGRASGKQSPAR